MATASSTVLFMAGAVSGIVEAFCVQPFDMVKTRHQLNVGQNPGVFSTLISLYKEGGVRLWYRGISAELVGMVPKSAAMYGTYGVVHRYLTDDSRMGNTSLAAFLSGLAASIPEALTVTPAQIVKVRLQAREHAGKYTGPVDCARKLLQQEGLQAFSIGLGPTIIRNSVWNSIYFGLMHKIQRYLPVLPNEGHELQKTIQTFLSGFCGATFATCFNAPFDVVKSRFQCQVHVPGSTAPLKYQSTLQALGVIYKEEGLASCYKGFRPKAIRMGLGGAVAITIYDLFIKLAS
jgi:solute carrier family 25 (mitochondrial 2-oxodicarboxylate transporter), member 21